MFTISKDRSVIIRGVAILAMLWLHLFNRLEHLSLCQPLIGQGLQSFPYWLTAACNPVLLFVLLSGYGHYYKRHRLTWTGQLRRVLRLYVVWWAVLVLFIVVAQGMEPGRYLGNGWEIASNALAWHATFNAEAWFLFPYALLSLTAKCWFALLERYKARYVLGVALALSVFYVYPYDMIAASDMACKRCLLQLLSFCRLVFAFLLGAWMCKHAGCGTRFTHLFAHLKQHGWLLWLLLLLAVVAQCLTRHRLSNFVYTPLVAILLSHAPLAPVVQRVLTVLGRYSMPMWLVHTWFAYYLFKDYVYALRYPVLIFLALTLVSLATSWVVMQAVRPLLRRL